MFTKTANILKHFSSVSMNMLQSTLAFSFMALILILSTTPSFAVDLDLTADLAADVSSVAENITTSVNRLPFFISGLAYFIGIVFGMTGIHKLRLHVENPAQVKLSASLARFVAGAALLSLPTIYEAMYNSIGNLQADEGFTFSATNFMSAIFGQFSGILGAIGLTRDLNAVLATFLLSIAQLPYLLSAFAYLLGLYLGFLALLKLKDHIEDPERNPLKEALIRFFIGACFLALPSIYAVMKVSISGDGVDYAGIVAGLFNAFGFLESAYNEDRGCTTDILAGVAEAASLGLAGVTGQNSLGTAICHFYGHMISLPAFLNAIAQLLGYFFGFWGLLKLRDHMADSRNTPLSQPIKRFIAGGAFFSFQPMISIIRTTTTPMSSTVDSLISDTVSSYAGKPTDCDVSSNLISDALDSALDALDLNDDLTGSGAEYFGKTIYCAIGDVLGPVETSLNFFTFVAGLIFLMIGISRLLKSEQDGPRAPIGLGTIGTFVTAGVLLSFSDFVRIITMNIFTISTTTTKAELAYASSISDGQGLDEFYATVSAILMFMMIIGLISFARGIFILRGVSEGNQQSSMMAGVTHIIGGTLAVNLGPLLNLVQTTLGITSYGMTFS